MELRFEVRGADRAIAKMAGASDRTREQAKRFVDRGIRVLYDNCRMHTSLADHTLRDLARLGHPYARRFAPNYLHPDYLVHMQSGTLTSGLRHEGPLEVGEQIIGVVSNDTWYDTFVQLGTSKMRPRPYMQQALLEEGPDLVSAARNLLGDVVVEIKRGGGS